MKLGKVLHGWRRYEELDVRAAAEMMDIDASTLWRVEQGKMPSVTTALKLMRWLSED